MNGSKGDARREEAVASRLIVALDLPTIEDARAMIDALDGVVSFFKIGLWLAFARGLDRLLEDLAARRKRVFLDTKMLDIPATVAAGAAAAADRGVAFLTVHAEPAAVAAAVRGRGDSAMRILAVTVLTSLTDADLAAGGSRLDARELVMLRARQAIAAGADGLVASAADDPDALRTALGAPDLLIVTPGIRPALSAPDDQRRTATPAEAIARGADYLVVGRPIVRSADPRRAAANIIAEMKEGVRRRGNLR